MKKITVITATLIIPFICIATNCPNGLTYCHQKGVFSRDIGEANASAQERELNSILLPNHHDFGVYEFDGSNMSDLSAVGLFADSFSDAVIEAAKYLALLGLNDAVGWVDGQVNSSGGTVGSNGGGNDITEAEYLSWLTELPSLHGYMAYHLVLWNCQHFASDLNN